MYIHVHMFMVHMQTDLIRMNQAHFSDIKLKWHAHFIMETQSDEELHELLSI